MKIEIDFPTERTQEAYTKAAEFFGKVALIMRKNGILKLDQFMPRQESVYELCGTLYYSWSHGTLALGGGLHHRDALASLSELDQHKRGVEYFVKAVGEALKKAIPEVERKAAAIENAVQKATSLG
jgi:hypothetical protein